MRYINAWVLKPDSSADTGAAAWPAAADLALDEDVSVFIADSHATCAAVALVVGIERAGEAGGGSAGGRIGELEGSPRSERTNEVSEWVSKRFYDTKGEHSFMLLSGGAAMGAAVFGGWFAFGGFGAFFGGTTPPHPNYSLGIYFSLN